MALAAVAGASAAAAYLDAKYHIRKDLADLNDWRKIGKAAQKAAKSNKISLWYFFEDQVNRLGDSQLLWYRTQPSEPAITYSYKETYDNCCRLANFLLANGVRPDELIATYLINSPEFIFNLVGSWSIGCAPAMINYNLGGDGLIHSLKIAKSKIVLVDEDEGCRQRIEEVRDRIEGELGMRIIILDSETKAAIAATSAERPDDEYRDSMTPDFPIFLFYTSGTTGFPKACAFPVGRSAGLAASKKRTMNVDSGPDGDMMYDCMPLYHGTGCVTALGYICSGMKLAIGRKFSVRNFWQDIHDSGATAFVYVGETARYLLAAPPSPLDKDHNLKSMYGNGMRPDVWRKFMDRFNVPIVNEFFNSTEGMLSLLNVCKGPFHDAHVGHHGGIQRFLLRNKLVPVQTDLENGDKIWRDPKTGFGRRKSYEEGGEILINCSSQQDFVGYWNNPDATGKRFERDVFRRGDLYYRSGDALRRDADGRWYFLDRLGDTFRWKSENVSTAQVAEVLGRFPGIVESNVYGVEVPSHDGRAGCAAIYINPEQRKSFDWAGLLEHGRKGLPKYAVPVFLRLLQKQSPMHNNKQNKVPLRKEGVDLKKVTEGDAGREDEILWVPPGGDRYVPFSQRDWNAIEGGKARL